MQENPPSNQSNDIFGPTTKNKRLLSRKTTFFLEFFTIIVSFIIFIKIHNPGIFIFTLILLLFISLIGKRKRKEPYEYLFDKNISPDSPQSNLLFRFDETYKPEIQEIDEISHTFISRKEKNQLYDHFKLAREYNTHWLNAEAGTIQLPPDDKIIISHWTPLQIQMKMSISDSIKRFIMLSIYFGIYALISYFVSDRGGNDIDAAMQALFFPFLPYILVCYRSLDKYLKALFLSFFVLSTIFIPMFNSGLLTEEGIPFLKYFLFIQKYFPKIFGRVFEISGLEEPIQFTQNLLKAIFSLEFVIMIIYSVIKSHPYVHIIMSQQAIYIRAKSKKSLWDIIIMVFWIILNPFNISQYKEIQNRIKYNRLTAKEGRNHDYSKISRDAVQKLKIKSQPVWKRLVLAGIFLVIGLLTLGLMIGIPFIGIGVLIILVTLRRKKVFKIHLDLKRSKVEGSWILSHQFDIFEFNPVPEGIAHNFLQF